MEPHDEASRMSTDDGLGGSDPGMFSRQVSAEPAISVSPKLGPEETPAERKASLLEEKQIKGGGISTYDWPLTSTEKLMEKYGFKADLVQFTRRLDTVLPSLASGNRDSIAQVFKVIMQLIAEGWHAETSGELVPAICAHLQEKGAIDSILQFFISDQQNLRAEAGQVLECCLSTGACTYLLQEGYLRGLVTAVIGCDTKDEGSTKLSVSLLESLFRQGIEACKVTVDHGGLDFLIDICKISFEVETLLHAAVAFSNLAIFGGTEIHKLMVRKHVPVWLFVLASHEDRRVKYYGCFCFCTMLSTKEIDRSAQECDTAALVASFLKLYKPEEMAKLDHKYRSGRSKQFLFSLSPLLHSSIPIVSAMAVFQLAMEATLRRGSIRIEVQRFCTSAVDTLPIGFGVCQRGTDNYLNASLFLIIQAVLQVFADLGFLNRVKEIATLPGYELASRFAVQILRAIGEPIPRQLTQCVPLWSPRDVQFWLQKIGYDHYVDTFAKHKVDGDLLLRTTPEHLREDLGMSSAYERMRFIRELNSLKRSSDYSAVDRGRLDNWLVNLDAELSMYTYQMLLKGVDRPTLIHLDDEILRDVCGVINGIHRWKILRAVREVKHEADLDLALLRKKVDIFICYRRSNGSQLASLLKVHLQLSGYKVFIDVDRLYAGQFNKSILMNVRAAKHFIIVLTPGALDPCIGDNECKDWVHLELKTALESGSNVVPVQEKGFDWPSADSLPADMQQVCTFSSIQWVHDYQEACVNKLHKYLNETRGNDTPKEGDTPNP